MNDKQKHDRITREFEWGTKDKLKASNLKRAEREYKEPTRFSTVTYKG